MLHFRFSCSSAERPLLVEALRPPVARTFTAVRIEVFAFLAIAVFLVANLPFLEAWPTAHNDEARELNAFWVASGADPRARGMDSEFGRDPLYKGGLQGLTVGLVLRGAGLGLLQGRLVSLAWGGALLVLVFLIGRRLYGPVGGALAVVCLAVSRPFLVASHMVRPDIVLAAMLAAICYLALRGVQDRVPWMSLTAGLLLGLALDVHLNTLAFVPLVGLIYVAWAPRFWVDRSTRLFVGGAVVGGVYYLLARVAPDPTQFADSSAYWLGIEKRPPVFSSSLPEMLAAELGRFQGYFTDDRLLELAVLVGALAVAAVRAISRRRLDPMLLGLLIAFGLFAALASNKTEFYLALFYPWLALLVAGAVVWLASLAPSAARSPLALLAMLAAPLVFGLPDNYEDLSTAATNFADRGYYALIEEIRPAIPPDASIIGPPLFWIGLSDHSYTDYYVWERLRAEKRERFSSYVARLKPDVAVLDAKSRHQVSINSPGFLENNAVLLKTVRHVGFDRVEVWKLS
jgi:4-amino-4-deoxy-L-arabinose transferase-like glycosyltransferase